MKQLLVLLVLFSGQSFGQHYDTLFINGQERIDVRKKMYYLHTTEIIKAEEAFDFFENKQAPKVGTYLSKGRFHPYYDYYYFVVKHIGSHQELIFSFDQFDTHQFTCIRRIETRIDTLIITGDALPLYTRAIPTNDIAVPFSLENGDEIEFLVFCDKRHESFDGEFNLESPLVYFQKSRVKLGWIMFFIGIITFIAIFNVFLWVSVRDNIHLLFVGQLIMYVLCFCSKQGLLIESGILFIPHTSSLFTFLFALACLGFNLLLIIYFLKLNTSISDLYKYLRYFAFFLIAFSLSLFCYSLFVDFPIPPNVIRITVTFFEVIFSFGFLAMFYLVIEQLLRKNSMAKIALVALLPIVIGFILSYLNRNFMIKVSPLTQKLGWVMPGVLLEQIVWALGLTVRYNGLKRENLELDVLVSKAQNEMSAKIINAEETERQRLAKDLHDDLGGTLSAIKGKVSYEKVSLEALNLVDKAIEDLRLVSHNLMPPELERSDLQSAIYSAIERFQKKSTSEFSLVTFGSIHRFEPSIELNIFRIVAEGLNNVIKHSKANKAVVQLIYHEDYLFLSIEDNGVGMESLKTESGIGLKNINSRVEFIGATLDIDSGSGGTTLFINIPYNK